MQKFTDLAEKYDYKKQQRKDQKDTIQNILQRDDDILDMTNLANSIKRLDKLDEIEQLENINNLPNSLKNDKSIMFTEEKRKQDKIFLSKFIQDHTNQKALISKLKNDQDYNYKVNIINLNLLI